MKKLEFPATFGHQVKQVSISQPLGAGGIFYITIENYHQGQMWKRNGQWVGYMADKSEITAEDIQILGEMIDEEMKDQK